MLRFAQTSLSYNRESLLKPPASFRALVPAKKITFLLFQSRRTRCIFTTFCCNDFENVFLDIGLASHQAICSDRGMRRGAIPTVDASKPAANNVASRPTTHQHSAHLKNFHSAQPAHLLHLPGASPGHLVARRHRRDALSLQHPAHDHDLCR